MEYLPSIADQTRLFLLALGFGFALGILYDAFRALRLLLTRKGGLLLVQDLLYALCCTVLSFFFFLTVSDGSLRGFGVAGEILGWLIYYFSLGAVAVRLTEALVRSLKKYIGCLLHCVFAPLWRWFRRSFAPLRRKSVKTAHFFKKNLHFHLQKTTGLLYNERQNKSTDTKGKEGIADFEPISDHAPQKNRTPAAAAPFQEEAYFEHSGSGGRAAVRVEHRLQGVQRDRGHGKDQSRKRTAARADSVADGGKRRLRSDPDAG
jgi:hypothetical protein